MAIAPKDDCPKKLVDLGHEFIPVEMKGNSTNPVLDPLLMIELWKILKKHGPDVVLTYMIKPNIYGSIACGLLRIPCICNVSKLETVFLWK